VEEHCLAVLLLAVAAMGQPILAAIVGEWSVVAARIASGPLCVAVVCLICPRRLLPVLAIVCLSVMEAVLILRGSYPPDVSLVRSLWRSAATGHVARTAAWACVPVGAAALGYLAVWARGRMPLTGRTCRTNLRLLNRRPLVFLRAYRWPLLAMLAGLLLDTVTTMRFMYQWGPGVELHPAMRIMARQFGVTAGVPVASAVRAGVVVFVAALWRRWTATLLLFAGVLYALAAASNHFMWL
jgi:hypothetical protein